MVFYDGLNVAVMIKCEFGLFKSGIATIFFLIMFIVLSISASMAEPPFLYNDVIGLSHIVLKMQLRLKFGNCCIVQSS